MALPPGVQTVTLIGQYLESNGRPSRGFLKFKAAAATAGSGVVIPTDEVRATLNNQGRFSIVLPTSDNSGLGPDGWTYRVTVILEGAANLQRFNILLQVGNGAEQDISDLPITNPVDPTATYATVQQLAALKAKLGYRHEQLTPASIWAIDHQLGYFPNVQSFNSADEEIIGALEHDDEYGLTIAFSAANGGYAILS